MPAGEGSARRWQTHLVAQVTRDERIGRGLETPMLSVIRKHEPISMNEALQILKREGRCGRGTTLRAGMNACESLEALGLIRPLGGETLQAAKFRWEAVDHTHPRFGGTA